MLSRSSFLFQQYKKQVGTDRKTSFVRTRNFRSAKTKLQETVDGDVVKGRGKVHTRTHSVLKDTIESMETPAIWLWYPWRRNPEPPTPFLPARRALKNLHGAVYTDLSPTQKKRNEEMMYGVKIPASREAKHDAAHPFLSSVLKQLGGQPAGFPFWYKKYPTRRHAYENRFNLPSEMLEGYSPEVKQAVSKAMMSIQEKQHAQESLYMERYALHDFDTASPAVVAVKRALRCRNIRNHLLTNPHNNIMKVILAHTEKNLAQSLRRLRKVDFQKYWEILRDHDVQDVLQPSNLVSYRWGNYWQYDWNAGLAISTHIPDFMDPTGLNGCVETGRSRSEVARDLGLSYTRALHPNEKKQLSQQAVYYERLTRFKSEQPEVARAQERARFVKKFSGMFAKLDIKSGTPDFPSTYRNLLGIKVLRWKSKRHGPM